jgi:hypothetical protein
MSVVNGGKTYYSVWRARGEKTADAKLHETAQLPIEIAGVDMELCKLAAHLKAEHNLPYADCFAAPRPMPLLPPVISAVFPSSFFTYSLLLSKLIRL